MRRVVITGLGFISVLGTTKKQVAENLYAMRCGIVAEQSRLEHGFRSPLTGAIVGFDAAAHVSKKQRRTMPDFALWAYAATVQALQDAALAPQDIRNERTGIIYGNDASILASFEEVQAFREAQATTSMGTKHLFRSLNSTSTMHLTVLLGTLGPSWTVSAACASGAHAVGQAFDAIRLGRQDVIIAGGCQEISMEAVSAFDGIGAFSTNPDPLASSRPFDASRDGLIPSGGAVSLILEDYEHARKRGRRWYAEMLGYGASTDGFSLVQPSETGLARAMRMALKDAGLGSKDIDLISAHATSTVLGDAAEAANIRALFGSNSPAVMALKSLTGHEFWMSGASQLAYTCLMAQCGFTAGTRNFECADEQTQGIAVVPYTREEPPRRVLLNAAGFGGNNASLVVECLCPQSSLAVA